MKKKLVQSLSLEKLNYDFKEKIMFLYKEIFYIRKY